MQRYPPKHSALSCASSRRSGSVRTELVTPEISVVSCAAKGVSTNKGYKHPRLERIQALLSHARPRTGGAVTMEAFDSADEKWKAVSLNRAVFVTTSEGDLVFESNGHGIIKRGRVDKRRLHVECLDSLGWVRAFLSAV